MKVLFAKRMVAVAIACLMVANAQATEGTWTGGDGGWSSANWDIGTGTDVDAQTAFGNANRLTGDHIANVSNGSTVDMNDTGDTRFQGTSVLNVTGGSTVTLDSLDIEDGEWTVADATINLDSGTLSRTISGTSVSGGFFMLGSWSGDTAQPATLNLDNGSTFFNDGVVTFGIEGESPEMTSMINITGGSLVDLTGGGNLPGLSNGSLSAEHDIIFYENLDESSPGAADGHNNTYAINFDGPGTLITDTGMSVVKGDSLGENPVETVIPTYEALWDEGYLTVSGGQSGVFSDHFTTSGTPGGVDYTLTFGATTFDSADFDEDGDVDIIDFGAFSDNFGLVDQSVNPAVDGDFEPDGDVDITDFGIFADQFGNGTSLGVTSVPEPSSAVIAMLAFLSLGIARRSS